MPRVVDSMRSVLFVDQRGVINLRGAPARTWLLTHAAVSVPWGVVGNRATSRF